MCSLNSIGWILRDKKFRKYYSKFEIKKKILKSFLLNDTSFFYNKYFFDFIFKKFTYNSSISRYRSSCMFLGNSRSILQRFKLSRHACKYFASHGFLVGLKRSSF